MYIYIYIYIYRERERERDTYTYMYYRDNGCWQHGLARALPCVTFMSSDCTFVVYTRSPLQYVRLFAPSPWKILALMV